MALKPVLVALLGLGAAGAEPELDPEGEGAGAGAGAGAGEPGVMLSVSTGGESETPLQSSAGKKHSFRFRRKRLQKKNQHVR
jgi:hypothetical protein